MNTTKIIVNRSSAEIRVTADVGTAYFSEYSTVLTDEMEEFLIQKVKNGILHHKINNKMKKIIFLKLK